MTMTNLSKRIYFLVSVIFFIFFDIFFSNIIVENIDSVPKNSIMDLLYVQNTGAAFSILQNSKIFLVLFSAIVFLCIMYYVLKNIKNVSTFSIFWVSLLSSGIFCNLYERISLGYVRDFFKLNFINFPVFNISDVFINLSVFVIVVIIVKHNYSKNNEDNN